jgi:transcription initiation factor TFIIB
MKSVKRSSREALVNGLTELDEFVTGLDLDSTVQARATEIYRNAVQTDELLDGRGVEMIAAGCVVLAVRESNAIVDTQDVVDLASDHIEEKTIHGVTKAMRKELDLGFLLEDPHKFLEPIGDELDASPHDRELAETIVDIALEDGIASGKKAQTIAGSAYYVVSVLPLGDGGFTQRNVADAADITEVTIRNTYRDFAKIASEQLDDEFDPNKHRSAP